MIEHELILLGLLKESPRHGYEIKKQAREILSLSTGLNLKSVYYPLRILEKKGLVTKQAAKSGKRPLRFVYGLTEKGRSRFQELLTKSFLDFKRPQFSLDLSLYFLHYLKPELIRRRLRGRTRVLKKLSWDLRKVTESLKKKQSAALARISEHNLQMVEAERRFLASLIKSL